MKHIRVIFAPAPVVAGRGACGECQSSCQSACKTSCTVGNQVCEQKRIRNGVRVSGGK